MNSSTKRIFALACVAVVLFVAGCKQSKPTTFNEHIEAFTSGMVSNQTAINILFTSPIAAAEVGQKADPSLLKISPSIEGDLVWGDTNLLVFRPQKGLKPNAEYTVTLQLGKLIKDEEDFEFTFKVRPLEYSVDFENYINTTEDLKSNNFRFNIAASDFIAPDDMEQQISALSDGKECETIWEHNGDSHTLTVVGVKRKESPGKLTLTYSGNIKNVGGVTHQDFDVPALNDFSVMRLSHKLYPDQCIEIYFTDPLDDSQDLSGLVTIANMPLRFYIDNNILKVYPSQTLNGDYKVTIHQGILNVLGQRFATNQDFDITFDSNKPNLKLLSEGNIIPKSNGLVLPFKAVSLKSVVVRVIKLYENNIPYFLQTNDIDGSDDRDLKRAGSLVAKKTIRLNEKPTTNISEWNTFSLDLSKMIEPEPGAIYRVLFNYGIENAVYPCLSESDVDKTDADDAADLAREQKSWDNPNNYYGQYWGSNDAIWESDWDWEQRDNPCHKMYYMDRAVAVNLLASDLGIIAKSGQNNKMSVIVTSISTTAPLSGVDVEIYSYQNQLIGTGKTNSEGMVTVSCSGVPFLLIAKNDTERGYLRVDNSTSLSLSNFDVSGQTVQNGLKAFLYAERGVWRPGDSIYVSLMLCNPDIDIPEDLPVKFELINPHGQSVRKQMQPTAGKKLLSFKTLTKPDEPTGTYTVRATIGDAVFDKYCRVETVKPNRLKIGFDFGNNNIIYNNAATSGKLSARWLHGAKAANLSARVAMSLSPTTTTFKGYSNYCFDDRTQSVESNEIVVFNNRLDAEGNASVDINIPNGTYSGMMQANFYTRVFEESGDFSIDRFSAKYSPYKQYVGICLPQGDKQNALLTDKQHTINVATLSADGKPVDVSSLKCEVYKIDWRWWWESGNDDLASYSQSTFANRILSQKISTKGGKGSFDIEIKYPEWGRYLVRVVDEKGGHSCSQVAYFDWPGWAMKPAGEGSQAAKVLSLTLNKTKVNVGDKVSLSFPSTSGGRAVVSIENGSSVIEQHWVVTANEHSEFEFEATPQMSPNVYVSVTMLQPHSQANNDLPIRMYGIVPLLVEDASTHLSPIVKMPNELAPNQTFTIDVSEANGKEMDYTLAIVEDGLLDLTRFETPAPWQHFFAREALGVRTWDVYDRVVGAYGGRVESVFGIGGDADMVGKKSDERANRFKPVVIFKGPFHLKRGKNSHKITMPYYVGSVRAMVVACSQNAYGNGEATAAVRTPLMLLTTLPRVVRPTEAITMPVTVFSMAKSHQRVDVRITKAEGFEVIGQQTQQVDMEANSESIVYFELKVKNSIGVGRISVSATAGTAKASEQIEMDICNQNVEQTKMVHKLLKAGESATLSPLAIGTNTKTQIEVSALPPLNLGSRLHYLIQYPHGCAEQTTSAIFPQIYLPELVDVDDALRQQISANVVNGINRLSSLQTANGGIGYWPNSASPDEWASSYVAMFAGEASRKGYFIPAGFQTALKRYQKKMAQAWEHNLTRSSSDSQQAFRLLSLASMDAADMPAMNRMRNVKDISPMSQWILAAAYARAGYADVASQLIAKAKANIGTDVSDDTYGSDIRNMAMQLQTYCAIKQFDKAFNLAAEISKHLSSDEWMSTQTVAYSLLAISQYAEKSGVTKSFAFSYKQSESKNIKAEKPYFRSDLPSGASPVSVTNKSDGSVYVCIISQGVPEAGDETNYESNLSMNVSYFDISGKPLDVASLTKGTDIVARVSVRNNAISDVNNLALTQIFPSGWEIRNTRLEDGRQVADYTDYRDDRIYNYFSLRRNEAKSIETHLHAAYGGKFYLPAVKCEAMYNNTISAVVKGQWVEVK